MTLVYGSSEALASNDAAAGDKVPISRFAVAFRVQQKEVVQRQLVQQGYQVLFEGPGFFTVIHQSLVVPSSSSTTGARRRLIERMHQQHVGKHLEKLSVMAGTWVLCRTDNGMPEQHADQQMQPPLPHL